MTAEQELGTPPHSDYEYSDDNGREDCTRLRLTCKPLIIDDDVNVLTLWDAIQWIGSATIGLVCEPFPLGNWTRGGDEVCELSDKTKAVYAMAARALRLSLVNGLVRCGYAEEEIKLEDGQLLHNMAAWILDKSEFDHIDVLWSGWLVSQKITHFPGDVFVVYEDMRKIIGDLAVSGHQVTEQNVTFAEVGPMRRSRPGGGGRPKKWDWEGAFCALAAAIYHGDFKGDDRRSCTDFLQEWFAQASKGDGPHLRDVQKVVSRLATAMDDHDQ